MENYKLHHTILALDIETIKKYKIKPIKGDYSIICDKTFYFYNINKELNEDFKNLNFYLYN